MNDSHDNAATKKSWLDPAIQFCLQNKLVVVLVLLMLTGWGLLVAPFDWPMGDLPRAQVPVDAIPDLGENQQIVFTRWSGRSPRDIEDQVTYPLTATLMGIPGLKTVRSFSYFGFSTVYLIFEENIDFYWSRSRVLEKLNSLPPNTIPKDATPTLGPDATALGQIYWYTLEGRDSKGKPVGGWDRYELRKIQDWYVRYALQSASGVAEVASIGGFVPEYQIDVDPDKLRIHNVTLQSLYQAIRSSNQEVGARTMEINSVEYVIRARGYLKNIQDIENTVIKARKGTPVTVKDVANVTMGPAPRRGALDKDGAEVVGGVVVARYGANPLQVIKNVKAKLKEIANGLPQRKLKDGRISQVTVVPFYDRTKLINETLNTLEEAITLEVLVTILVVLVMLMHFRSSLLISGTLPVAVLFCFIAMKQFKVDANIVALSGIAIAIGTMVDMGVVLSENIVQYLQRLKPNESALDAVFRATSEVGGAILTAVSTTVISFLPVFTMEASEGKLFRPLAYTKTFALLSSLLVALFVLPPLAHLLFHKSEVPEEDRAVLRNMWQTFGSLLLLGGSVWIGAQVWWWLGALLGGFAVYRLLSQWLPKPLQRILGWTGNIIAIVAAAGVLAWKWTPLGHEQSYLANFLFVASVVGGLLLLFELFRRSYRRFLRWFLAHKLLFLMVPFCLVLFGGTIWLGFETVFGWIPRTVRALTQETTTKKAPADSSAPTKMTPWEKSIRSHPLWVKAKHAFPGLQKEFMPDLDEGSFLLMPTTMPHASMGEALAVLSKLDRAIRAIPEVSVTVGKIGRAESALDPAPISMVETVIHYKAKYRVDASGKRIRQWRKHINTPKDIWNEIVKATKLLGTTSAPHLQPIGARLVMLQSGMRAPMGIKVKGPSLEVIEKVAVQMEKLLKKVPQISPATVLADRVIGKPYLEFHIDRKAIARYGLGIAQVQQVIQMAIGGSTVTTTIEGRERYSVVLRYQRELRNNLQALQKIMVATPQGAQIPLFQLASLKYVRGPQVIKSEDNFLVAYIVFDRKKDFSEVATVEAAKRLLKAKKKSGEFKIPAGVSYKFSGTYESQVRAEKKLMLVLPLALFLIFLILYLQFRSAAVTGFIFSGILVAWAGGFVMIWLYQQSWFMDFSLLGINMREVFTIHSFNMSVAIWVGFIALFGIATDDGVVMATYLDQSFASNQPQSIEEIRQATLEAGARRIRPCLMTTATTLLALLPILTSSGRGSDIMIPMAIPSFGGMFVELLTLFVVPVLYCWRQERSFKKEQRRQKRNPSMASPELPETT
ncbi:MAG: efflux RND transporter permease subunit [Deltaproteobacteria bacterium]|nr:MAG: efflux RND transporter permease subunit [Deltaproteobacteria bacterium]